MEGSRSPGVLPPRRDTVDDGYRGKDQCYPQEWMQVSTERLLYPDDAICRSDSTLTPVNPK